MTTFIKKHEYNYIKKCLNDLNSTFRGCVDVTIIEATKAYIQDKILGVFKDLSADEKELLTITKVTDPLHINKYLDDLNAYVYGMENITNAQISRLFKKEKKLKFPPQSAQDSKNVYLGWSDPSIGKLFIAYNMNDKIIGMACRVPSYGSNNSHTCTLCNHIGGENEVAFVSPVCKASNTVDGTYRSIGFDLCLDSEKCNERIVTIEKLEKLLKNVNNIK